MSVQEMVAEIPKLSINELKRLQLLIDQKLRMKEASPSVRNSVTRLRGIAKLEQPLPDDWDWKKVKEDYLMEKYSR